MCALVNLIVARAWTGLFAPPSSQHAQHLLWVRVISFCLYLQCAPFVCCTSDYDVTSDQRSVSVQHDELDVYSVNFIKVKFAYSF